MPGGSSFTRRFVTAGIVAVLTASVIVLPAPATGSLGVRPVEPSFTWSMPDRYGVDRDRDGIIDLPNTAAYVQGADPGTCVADCGPPEFPVEFLASIDGAVEAGTIAIVTYEWTLHPAGGEPRTYARHDPRLTVRLPEGRVDVRLRVLIDVPFITFYLATRDTITVDDVLVVAIGDSYASGEGNPEVRRGVAGDDPVWADGVGDPAVEADHAAARRSSAAWPSQVALALERSQSGSSVTFVSVAASSATVARGLLGPQNASLPLAQVPRVAELVGERQIDLLLVTIGGNDIGFSRLIAGLVDADSWLDPICYETDLGNVWASVADGQWNRASRLAWRIGDPFRIRCRTVRTDGGATLAGLQGLPAELDRLAEALGDLGPRRVLVMEYPDPTGYSDGPLPEVCDEIIGDAAPLGLHEIDRSEQLLGRSEVLVPLNAAIRDAARRHGWGLVTGVSAAFTAGHGYCAEWPDYGYPAEFGGPFPVLRDRLDHPDAWYRAPGLDSTPLLPGPVSWYRTAGQSVVLQGPDSRTATTGTMHPNELGHRAMANLALAVLSRSR